jgi:hypothetical protein
MVQWWKIVGKIETQSFSCQSLSTVLYTPQESDWEILNEF